MTVEALKERISAAEQKIEKKKATIEKKTKWIASGKKDEYEIHWLQDDIKRLTKEIAETEKTIENYRKQLSGEIEKEEVYLTEIPEVMKRLQDELVTVWDEWDKNRKAYIIECHRTMPYEEYARKFTYEERYEFAYASAEETHADNIKDAKALILELYYRVKKITGEITDWSGIMLVAGAQGFSTLNGVVIGKEGKCRVESIYAGGYNIQRFHIRVLTHEIR